MTRVRLINAARIIAITVGLTGSSFATQHLTGPDQGPPVTHQQIRQEQVTPGSENPIDLKVQVRYSTLPLSFEANQGQTDWQAQFLSRGKGYTLFLTPTEAVLALRSGAQARDNEPGAISTVLRMRLVAANPHATVTGLDALPGKAHYFIGNDPQKWRTNIPTYAAVRYQTVYPDVDLVYYGTQRQLEYDFIVAPGADPRVIRLTFEGADSLDVDAEGDLVLRTTGGELRLHKPLVYQETDGLQQQIPGTYRLTDTRQVGFQLAAYDRSRPLVIDPVLTYATYLGGNDLDSGYAIAVDAAGNAYVTGSTWSSDFPTANALQPAKSSGPDAFIAKVDTTGTALLYSTYFGGASDDWGNGIAVDEAGNAYVTGETWSSDFPRANALRPVPGGIPNAFVAKLDPAGRALLYSTYLGGNSDDGANGIAVDSAGNAYVTGYTSSADFPTVNALQPTHGEGFSDAFVAKLDPAGSALIYATYLGGSSYDVAYGIAVDHAGNAYLTGLTGSTDFPTVNPLPPARVGLGDAFVAKLDPAGSTLIYATSLGGSSYDGAYGIAVDRAGNAYVTGYTSSADFPTANAFQAVIGKATLYQSRDGGQSWSESGLSNLGVAALAIDRMNSSTLYVGTQGSGVFKSTDGGVSWTAVNTGLIDLSISDLAIDPQTPSTLYAGTSESGVFKSTDGGEVWSAIGPPVPGPIVRSVAVAPAVPTTLYAAVRFWVMKSLDGGATWASGGPDVDSVNDLEIDPVITSTIYASVTRSTPSGGGLYKSADGGTTWSLITRSVLGPTGRRYDVDTVAIDSSNTSTLYIVALAGGIFKTADGGLNWAPMNNGLTDPDVSTLAIDTSDPSILYAGTGIGGVFKTTDSAGSWTAVNNGLVNPRVTALAVDPTDPSRLYAGTFGRTSDAFLAKLDASGSALVYSTYLGGEYYDEGRGVVVDSQGNAYVTGITRSFSFPTANALQPTPPGGASDAFIAKFDPAGAALKYSTYLGGSDDDFGYGIALDSQGDAYVTGMTRSFDFPTATALQPANAGSDDAFVAKLTEPDPTPRP